MVSFSVIMPSYNSSLFIKTAIESVLNQDFKDWELLVVDDHSNDESWNIISEYARKHDSILGFKLSKHKGAAYARNYAIRKSKGRYIAFIDSDDYWLPNKLKVQYSIFKDLNPPIICSNYFYKKSKEKYLKNIIKFKQIILL